MKLSKTQEKVLNLMKAGWELSTRVHVNDSKAWLQEGGTGKGGEMITVSFSTLHFLLNNNLVELAESLGSLNKYKLKS